MATKENDDLDLAVGPAKSKGAALKKIGMVVGGSILLIAASVGTTLFVAKQVLVSPEVIASGKELAKAAQKKAPKEAIYVNLDPPFVVNFHDQGIIRFLQIGVQLLVTEQETADQLAHHMPVVRNNLLMIFSSLDIASVSDRAGKERLRETVLAEIQSILTERGVKGSVEAAYFTNFVMQ